MFDNSTTQCLLFPDIFHKPAVLQFDQRQGSSDGGALLLKAADRRYGLIARFPRPAPSDVIEYRLTELGRKILEMIDTIDHLDRQLRQGAFIRGKTEDAFANEAGQE